MVEQMRRLSVQCTFYRKPPHRKITAQRSWGPGTCQRCVVVTSHVGRLSRRTLTVTIIFQCINPYNVISTIDTVPHEFPVDSERRFAVFFFSTAKIRSRQIRPQPNEAFRIGPWYIADSKSVLGSRRFDLSVMFDLSVYPVNTTIITIHISEPFVTRTVRRFCPNELSIAYPNNLRASGA